MDFMYLPLEGEELEEVGQHAEGHVEEPASFECLSERNIVPQKGTFLGLDISKDSTGICLYCNGERLVANISIDGYNKDDPLGEARARMALQQDLESLFAMREEYSSFDVIVIEDVFEGVNPATTRLLYALNTAIDELILWGRVQCKKFVRVSNQSWKGWLNTLDSMGELKGLNDKIKVQRELQKLGISESGEGYQDRLDATGMLLGYFIHQASMVATSAPKGKSIRVQFSEIAYAFEEDEDLIKITAIGDNDCITSVVIDDAKMSKKKMIDYLSSNIEALFITKKPIMLGFLAGDLGIPVYPGQSGYFGFWLKEKARLRYLKKLEEVQRNE